MKLKKRLALLLVAVMISTLMPTIGFAEEMAALDGSKTAPVFTDMPNNWSTAALQNAVDNGLLKGDNGRLRPGDSLTRAEMASIINRAFGATAEAALTGYQDVSEKSWYYEEMGKALQMGTFQGGGDGLLRPQDPITRQEVFVVVARAFKLNNGSNANLNGFADQAKISSWAMSAAAALVDAGYIQGSNGRLNPKENITRAEFAKIMDGMLTGYLNAPGSVEEVPSGNIMINVPGVTLKNLAVKGDLIIGDGVGEGNVSLENVTIAGRLVVRGGGENSILITGNSNVDSIIIAKVKGKVRVFTADGTEIGEVLADGSDDVILEGNFSSITVQSNNIVVNAVKAEIGDASIEGNNSTLLVGSGSSVERVQVTGNNVTIEGSGNVDTVQVYSANVVVKTMNTTVTAETGSAGVDAAGTSVSAGNTVITRPPATSGGGGGSTAPPPPQSDFAGGAGTVASPYQVATAAQLNKVRDHLDKHFIQTADINLGVAPWNEGNGWVPIGDDSNRFTGSYNGNGFSIEGLTINQTSGEEDSGLFGYSSGSLTRIDLINASVNGQYRVGALVGKNKGLINQSSADGQVSGISHVGGLVGYHATPGAINQSSSIAEVQGSTSWIGGLVGNFNSGSVRNSYATGKVTGGDSVGGLIGYMPYGIMENCFSAGRVSGGSGLGGLVGTIQTPADISITNSYWDAQESNQATSAGGGTGYSTSAMIKVTNGVPIYVDWDFTGIWGMETGTSYPYLKWQDVQTIPYPTYGFAGGTGTEANPYQVATAAQLNKVRDHLDKHFIQTADINLGEAPWNEGDGWLPIGDYVNGASFRGIYDGGNYRIIGLFINRPAKDGVGLFGETSHGAVVKNLKMINVDVTGRDYVGAASGGWGGYVSLVDSTLINVHVSGSVKGRQYVGGLIGTNSTIRQSSSAANVNGGDAGGLAGMLTRYGNVIEQSYATGEITGLVTGGLIGHNNYGRIINSYSLAQVKGTGANNGGVIGQGYHSNSVLTNVFAAGVVESGGGLIGVNHNGGTDYEVSSYWDKEATGKTTSANSNPFFGKTTEEMITWLTFIGWDFDIIWNIDEGSTYPYLRNNMQDPKPTPEIGL
jgi:hypothetical protein